jgi:hypothetical protein
MTPQRTWRSLNVCCTLPVKVILPNINGMLPKLKWTAQDLGHFEFAAVVGILQPGAKYSIPHLRCDREAIFNLFTDRPITLVI